MVNIYNFICQKYTEHYRTGKSTIKFPVIDIKKSKESNKPTLNNIYECGHSSKPIIMNMNIYTMSVYIDWLNNNPNRLCLNCWFKHKDKNIEKT